MQIPVRKIKQILLAVTVSSGIAYAQTPSAPVAPPPAAPVNTTGNAPAAPSAPGAPAAPATSGADSSTSTALDYLYNHKPQEGSAADQASQANEAAKDRAIAADAIGLGKISDPQVRARFEKYLGMSEIPAADLAAYAQDMQKVRELLRANKTFEAWQQLRQLGRYQTIDAGVSIALADRIESMWNTDKASNRIDNDNQQLKQEIKQANGNADLMSTAIRKDEIVMYREENHGIPGKSQPRQPANNGGVPQADSGGGSNTPSLPSTQGLEGRMQLTEEYMRSLEAKAKIKLNELKAEKLFEKAKSDFADYTQTLFKSGLHQHVILAADFYRKIFDEDEYPPEMANEVSASLEMARDVASSVDVFRYKVSKNEIAAATSRLQEAFTTSEFQPALLGLERPLKEKIDDYFTRLDKMENLIEARDFGPLEAQLNETQKIVADFDPTKALALVNAVKLESKLHLGKAKLAAQQGDLKGAMDEFQDAAKAWPGNPALQDSSTAFFDTQDTKNQSTTEFDRLIAENNYRGLFDKQLQFGAAVHGDSKREDQLKNALEKVKNAEIAAEKANVMRNAGDVFGAWETIELAAKDLPNDNKLNGLRADLAGKGAEFVAAINKAKDAETRSELGFSLTWYAVAQRYYPASTMANEAIERLSKQILGEGKAKTL